MVEKSYKRQENIDDIIQTAKLPYNAWKILFLIDGEMSANQISELLDEEKDGIEVSLNRLEKERFIQAIEEMEQEEEEIAEEAPEALSPEISPIEIAEETPGEPALPAETEVREEIVGIPEEEPDSELQEITEPAPMEAPDETDIEPQMPAADIPEIEETVSAPAEEVADLELDELPEVESSEDLSEPEYESALWEPNGNDAPPAEEQVEENEQDFGEADAFIKQELNEPEEDIEINIPADEPVSDEESIALDFNFDENAAPVVEEEASSPLVDQIQQDIDGTFQAPVGTITVLVIDDSIVIRKMVEIALEDEDFVLETAISGKDGLTKIDQLNPDILILDLMLPDINGIEILKTVKSTKKMPVIMLSGKDSPQMVESAKSEGADAFLPKPFKDEELVDKIKTLLNI